ncbi:MAG: biotin/lipoyl-containing protein, partial [Tepidisphaeraceae bacterium]
MPQLSDTMTEGTIVKWNKKEGDKVRAGEEIAEIETDKATMPMESFESGTLAVIMLKEGDKVPVGGLLAVIATGSEKAEEIRAKYAKSASSSARKPPAPPAEKVSVQAKRAEPARVAAGSASFEDASVSEIHEADGVG